MSEDDYQPPRRPRVTYKGQNGFVESSRLRAGQTQTPNLHDLPKDADESAIEVFASKVRDAAERRHFVEDVLHLKGSYFPGVVSAKEMDEQQETAASLKLRIDELRRQHRDEMQTLYDWQAADYLEEAKQMCLSKDDAVSDSQTDSLYRALHRPHSSMISTFDNAASAHRYAYLQTVDGLLRRHRDLAAHEDTKRRRLDAQFPASVTEFRAIRNKDVQVRVAKFLMSDKAQKEKMMSEFRWAWRQVKILTDEYEQNSEFKTEIQDLMREVEARDPRRKSSFAS